MSGTTKILKSNPFQIRPLNKKQIMDLGLLNTEVGLIRANPTYNRDNAIWEKKHVALLKPKKKRNEPGKKYLARRVEVTKAKAEKEEAPVDELIWPDEQPFKLGKFQLPKDWFDQDENDKQIQQTKGKLSRSGKTLRNFYGGPPFPALVYLTLRQGEQASPGETKSAAPPVPTPDFSTIPVPIVPEVPTGETKLQHQPTTMIEVTERPMAQHAHNPIEHNFNQFKDVQSKRRLEQETVQAASKIQAIQRGNTTRMQKAKQEALALAEENARIEQEQLREGAAAHKERSDARFKEKNPAPKDPRYSGGRKRRRKTKRKSKRKTRKHKKKHRRKTKRKRRVKRRRRTRRR